MADVSSANSNGVTADAWLRANSGKFEIVSQRRDIDGETNRRALEIVQEFIIERDLILYGGQEIDYALRLRGGEFSAGIYPEHQIPDFDVYSPRNVEDAYDLTERLAAEGFRRVVAAPGFHVQTMRVKTDFIYVADISYVSPEQFSRMPVLDYRGMKILHPDYQRMDMHLAFCFPFNNPPTEDVFHRFGKDLRRLNLLNRAYPFRPPPARGRPGGDEVRLTSNATVEIGAEYAGAYALHGFAAYGVLRGALDELAAAARARGAFGPAGDPPPEYAELRAPRVAVEITPVPESPVKIAMGGVPGIPADGAPLAVVSPAADSLVASVKGGGVPVCREAYMGQSPPSVEIALPGGGGFRAYSTKARLLAVVDIRPGVRIVSPQFLLLHMLHEAFARGEGGAVHPGFAEYYRHVWDILVAADAIYARLVAAGDSTSLSKQVEASPFGLTVRTIGDTNESPAYRARRAKAMKALYSARPDSDASVPTATQEEIARYSKDRIPALYGPSKKRPPPFDYRASPFFRSSGEVVECPRQQRVDAPAGANRPSR